MPARQARLASFESEGGGHHNRERRECPGDRARRLLARRLTEAWLDAGRQRRRARRWAEAFEQGDDVAFFGYASGPVSYRPSFGDGGGAFVLSSGELFWTADPKLGRSLWHRVPNGRLFVQHRTQGPDASDQGTWPGYECVDDGRTVILLCEPDAERYLRAALFLPESATSR